MSPSDSIKVVPGRSKSRVESSNPVPTGNSVHKSSKVKLISPEEAMRLSSGVAPMGISPARRASRATSGVPVPVTTPEEAVPRPILVRRDSDSRRPRKSPRVTFELPERSSEEVASPEEERRRRKPSRVASDMPRRQIVLALPALSSTQFARHRSNPSLVRSMTIEPPLSVTVEPHVSPRALEIRSRVKELAPANVAPVVQGTTVDVVEATANAAQVVKGTTVQAGYVAEDQGSKEIPQTGSKGIPEWRSITRRQLISDENLLDLVLYLPTVLPTWNGRIVGSATMPELDCKFWGKPVSHISQKAFKLAKKMPKILKGELLPTGSILNDVFCRSPSLSDVAMYFFPDEKEKERSNGETAHLFESNAMTRLYVEGTELMIFSSQVLDTTSQYIINTQRKSENFLWGCFLPIKNSQAPAPEQADKDLDADDMVLNAEHPPPSLASNLNEKSQSTPSTSPVQVIREVPLPPPPGFENLSRSPARVKTEDGSTPGSENPSRSSVRVMSEVSVPPVSKNPSKSPVKAMSKASVPPPPGYESIWTTPLVKLNIQGTSNPASEESGFAGVVRDLSGTWLFGYSRCFKSTMPELTAELLAMYNGLSILWDNGFRDIRLETTNREVIEALTTKSNVFHKKNSILDRCKDLILKNWKCDIYPITKEQNSCAEWLASRLEEEVQGLVFYETPPRGLIDLLDKDRPAAAAEERQSQ